MGTELLERAPRWILPGRGRAVLCAVSGGLDSMCLLHLLSAWCRAHGGQVVAAHFNHRLRPNAGRDEDFVRSWCAAHAIPFVSGSGDVAGLAQAEGLSIEEAGRQLRYAFLRREAERLGGARIYTAHHADDNAETVLFNLIRGTGTAGLSGMAWQQDGVYRPLLAVRRRELADYAAAEGVPHVEDETNSDPDAAARNLLRLRVMPLLEELNSAAVANINRAAAHVRSADQAIEAEAARRTAHVEVQEGRVTLSLRELGEASGAVKARMLLQLFDCLGTGRKDIGSAHLQAILTMARSTATGKEGRLDLPHGVTARFCRGWLMLETRPQPLTEVQLQPGQTVTWGDWRLTLLDRQEGAGLALRQRRQEESAVVTVAPVVPGERLSLPETRGGGRSIKRLCLDHRISLAERDRLPAIYAGGELAAVWRLGVDEAFIPSAGAPCRFIRIERSAEKEETP